MNTREAFARFEAAASVFADAVGPLTNAQTVAAALGDASARRDARAVAHRMRRLAELLCAGAEQLDRVLATAHAKEVGRG